MAWRNLRAMSRNPDTVVFSSIQPVIFVLMFRYVFGGAINTPGIPYVDYLSTVSGGGYIGSCLSSLLSHPSKAKPEPDSYTFDAGDAPYFTTHEASFPFNPNAAEQPALSSFNGRDQLRHLRTHGDFLIARRKNQHRR